MSDITPTWEEDALARLAKAPLLIRKFARKKVEKAAIENSIDKITVEFMEKVRKQEMKKV